jgi:hypothetical protein
VATGRTVLVAQGSTARRMGARLGLSATAAASLHDDWVASRSHRAGFQDPCESLSAIAHSGRTP